MFGAVVIELSQPLIFWYKPTRYIIPIHLIFHMLKFAITIPNFNHSHFLPSALKSIKIQTVTNNVALMDGGSTDNLKAVIKEYSDLITYFRHKPDAGQAAAIQKGKENISGDIVAWLNADDYYFPDDAG